MSEVFSWREAPAADFAVIGDPVAHSRSPWMHGAAYRELGLDLRYVAVHVPVGEVAEALDRLSSLGYQGVNVTVPHKEAAMEWCVQVEPTARRVRAVNTVRLSDRSGVNTDAPGFMDTLRDLGLEQGGTCLMLGAGGSARALAVALEEAGWRLRIWNRTASRAEEMVSSLGLSAEVLEEPQVEGAGLLLNTTSASLSGAELPIDWSVVSSASVAYDLAYGQSPFLATAAAHGLRTCDGLPLLVAQGARSLEWWLGVEAPRRQMAEAIG